MPEAFVFGERDLQILKEKLDRVDRLYGNTPVRHDSEHKTGWNGGRFAPEVYVALPPAGGIPAMDRVTSGTSPTDDAPGYATCDVYRINPPTSTGGDAGIEKVGRSEIVYTVGFTDISDLFWTPVCRTKMGGWLAIPPDQRLEGILDDNLAAATAYTNGAATATLSVYQKNSSGDMEDAGFNITVTNRLTDTDTIAAGTAIGVERISSEWRPYWADCGATTL